MKKLMLTLCVTACLSGLTFAQATNDAAAAGGKAEMKAGTVYSCSQCHMEAKEAGKCAMCGETMKAMHKMKGADGKTYVCECAPGDCPANCTVGADDKTKCTPCGKPAHEAKFMKGDKKTDAPAAGGAKME